MTRETRGDSKGDAGSARQDGLLPFPTARRAGPLLRPRRPPRRHVAHREGLPERGWPQQGDRAGAQDDREDAGRIAPGNRGTERDRPVGGRRDLRPVWRADPLSEHAPGILGGRRPAVPLLGPGWPLRATRCGGPPPRARRTGPVPRCARRDGGSLPPDDPDVPGGDGRDARRRDAPRGLPQGVARPPGRSVFLPRSPATSETAAPRLEGFERELFQRLQRLGYEVLPTARSPFDALSKRELTTFLTGIGGAESALDRKAEVVSNISRVVEKDSVMFVVRRAVRTSIRGVPVIGREELRRAKDSDAVEEMISERKG